MSIPRKLLNILPLPKQYKLEFQRSSLNSEYAKRINKARKCGDKEEVRELKNEFRYAIDMHEEDEDAYQTKDLLRKARHLRVPIPHRVNEAGEESEFWYQGNYTGGWYLTNEGIKELRKEIRDEVKARQETRAAWVIWVTGVTGIVGAISGLLAIISKLN